MKSIFLIALLAAQQGYFETFEVRLHNLEVVVTDAKGKPVHGLTKDDFIILEDGVPQTITNFSPYEDAIATVSGTPASRRLSGERPAPVSPRRIVFFVDDMAVQNAARNTLLRQATRFVDEMNEGDLGAVIRPTGANRVAQDYTTDTAAVRKALKEAIESSRIRGDAPGLFELRELQNSLENADTAGDRMHARGLYTAHVRERVQQRLSQLRALVGSMTDVEGRKVLVIITAGLPSSPGRDTLDVDDQLKIGTERLVTEWGEPGSNFNPVIDELGRTAAANGVTIYALEPEVPLATGVQKNAASKTVGSTQGQRGIVGTRQTAASLPGSGLHAGGSQIMPAQMLYELLHYRGETLTSLTEKTGGKWFRGVATIDDVFRQVASDLSVYYSMAYRATGTRDKPRRIEVRVRNRPELRVRTRSEVVDRSPEREMGDLTAANLLFPRQLNELHVAVQTSGKPAKQGKLYDVPVDVVIPLDKLTFAQTENEKYVAAVDIHFAVAAHENNFTTSGKHRQLIEISPEQHAARAGVTYRFKTNIQVTEGPSRIAIGVMDEASRLAGFRNVEVIAQ